MMMQRVMPCMFGTQAQTVQAQEGLSAVLLAMPSSIRAPSMPGTGRGRRNAAPAPMQHAKHSSIQRRAIRGIWSNNSFHGLDAWGKQKHMCLQDEPSAAATAPHAMPASAEATHLQASFDSLA